jgi:membrane protease YdiL (CAAX protease family)
VQRNLLLGWQINVPWGAERAALGLAIVAAVTGATIGVALLVWDRGVPLLAVLVSTAVFDVALIASAFRLGPAGRGPVTLLYGPVRLSSREMLTWGALALAGSITLSVIYANTAGALSADLVPPPLPDDLDFSELRWVAFVIIVVMGPFAEETFFRGFLFAALLPRFGTAGSVVISSSAFALAHVDIALFAPAFLSGSVFALVYWRTGSVWPAVLAHTAQNAIAFGLSR